jgi:hypothetical protein
LKLQMIMLELLFLNTSGFKFCPVPALRMPYYCTEPKGSFKKKAFTTFK